MNRLFVNRRFCSPIGLHRISLVRASGGMFKSRVFDAVEGMWDARFLGELFCRRPVLPSPAPPPRRALRPVRLWYVRVLDSARKIGYQLVVNCGFCSAIGLHGTSLGRASGETFALLNCRHSGRAMRTCASLTFSIRVLEITLLA